MILLFFTSLWIDWVVLLHCICCYSCSCSQIVAGRTRRRSKVAFLSHKSRVLLLTVVWVPVIFHKVSHLYDHQRDLYLDPWSSSVVSLQYLHIPAESPRALIFICLTQQTFCCVWVSFLVLQSGEYHQARSGGSSLLFLLYQEP